MPTTPFSLWDSLTDGRQQLGLLGREARLPRHLSEPSTPFPSLHREETHTPCTVNGFSDPTVKSQVCRTSPMPFSNPYMPYTYMYIYMHIDMCLCMCSYLSRDCGQIPDINNLRMENSIKPCSLRGRSPSQEARHGSRCPHGVQRV